MTDRIAAVVGIQWGDEGKGKLVDILAANAKACGRYNGGANAGHTIVYSGQKIGLHLVPCGILHADVVNVIGNGVVIHLPSLAKEIDAIAEAVGHSIDHRIVISSRAHLIFGFHMEADGFNEDRTSGTAFNIGTTRKGIGPVYAAKALRISLRLIDLKKPWEEFKKLYRAQFDYFSHAYAFDDYDVDRELEEIKNLKSRFAPLIQDIIGTLTGILATKLPRAVSTSFEIDTTENAGDKILLAPWHLIIEGANATMLDNNVGTYPFCTSSNVLPAGVGGGLSIDPRKISHIIGVVKSYSTRVGGGPFITELNDGVGEFLQQKGAEIGVSTGRLRRCGWLDLCVVKYSCFVTNPDSIMLTKLDVLTGLPEIKVCTRYRNNAALTPEFYFPADVDELKKLTPEYETFKGWTVDVKKCKSYDEFPNEAKMFVERIEKLMCKPILFVGVGPDRFDIITRDSRL